MKRYETIDFVEPEIRQPTTTPAPAAGISFARRDGSRLDVLNEKTGSYRIVDPRNPVDFYGHAVEVVYWPSLTAQYFAQRARA